jgi:hypothetical protein
MALMLWAYTQRHPQVGLELLSPISLLETFYSLTLMAIA